MKKPNIPALGAVPAELAPVLAPMKETIEIITGVRGGQLSALPSSAALADVITAVNTLIARLNAGGA